MNEKEYDWLKERLNGIGGSEASIVLGVNPWKSRLELWNDKVNKIIKEYDLLNDSNLNLRWGKILEPVIINEYKNITGRDVRTGIGQMKSSQYLFMIANLDGLVIDKEKGIGILEAKTKGAYVKWEEDIPIYYMIQMQHYLSVTGFKYASFTVLDFGKKDLLWYDVERDEKLIKEIIDEEGKFWDLVVHKIPPEPDNTISCQEYLRNRFSNEVAGKTIDLRNNQYATENANNIKTVKEEIKILEEDERENKNILMSIMGDAEIGIGDGYKITWKSPKDKIMFDVDKFKDEHLELYNKYISTEKQTRRFSIKFSE